MHRSGRGDGYCFAVEDQGFSSSRIGRALYDAFELQKQNGKPYELVSRLPAMPERLDDHLSQ